MRDRLIELLKNSRYLDVMYGDDRTYGKAADELLANGVMVVDGSVGVTNLKPLQKMCGMPLGEVAELITAKEEGRLIVPPCKVGDTVYFNKAETDEICPAKVIGIYINYYTPSMPLWITIEYESKLIGRQEEKMTSGVFELLCHYSREEAEAKLKGEQG